jgi:hypothetical protein
MPIDLAPHDLVLQDWGCPAVLRRASDVEAASSPAGYEVTVIPQTVRLTQSETIAAIQEDSRHFLIQSAALPDSLSWLDCELIVEQQIHRIISTEDSGTGGWVLLETHAISPRSAA